MGWPAIQSGGHTLMLAPTGSGKTLAAFLVAVDRLMFEPVPAKTDRCRVLYVSPLKALAVDVDKNLRAPLVGIARYAERMGVQFHEPQVHVRTGDTPQRDRASFQRNPSNILITTPESLYLMLTGNARDVFRSVNTVIIDEIHAMVNTKRGAHLALSLERLHHFTESGFQRIGLSATQRPLEEVARFLGGFDASESTSEELSIDEEIESVLDLSAGRTAEDENEDEDEDDSGGTQYAIHNTPTPRPVQIIDAGAGKQLDLRVTVPVEDMAKIGQSIEIPSGDASRGDVRSSIWPAIHPLILEEVRKHRSTLIFVNSRRLAERLASALNELAGEEIVKAHHGSLAREQRLIIEDELKAGRLPAMVATSSLELGIDMGAIDLVIQVEAPPSVASGLQRIGRAGHHVGVPSKGTIIPKYRGDLLACAALTERMVAGAVEEMHYPRNPLDVLAQQIVAMVSMDDWRVDDLERVIRGAAPWSDLPRTMLEETLDMLSGRYPSDDFAELRPRITWDRLNGVLYSRQGAKKIAITSGGTIPDRGLFGVFLAGAEKGKGRVGELDEEMVFETRVGDVFLLGASSWRVEEITHDRVLVSPAPGEPGRMPFWRGDSAGRPPEFGRAIGRLSRELRDSPVREAIEKLEERHKLDETAATNLLQYLNDQADAGAVPDDRTLVIESYMDEMGDWRVCILSPFGSRVHAPWAMAVGILLRDQGYDEVDIMWTDDGIVARFPDSDEPPSTELVIPDADEIEDLVVRALSAGGNTAHASDSIVSSLFSARFRENSARALLLPRKNPGRRAPLWQTRRRAAELLSVASQYGSFPVILETFRECLKDVFDMPALEEILRQIRSRDIRVVPVVNRIPSPFAASLMFNYVANFMYEGDQPLAERRAQALTLDVSQLKELLGESELRQLLDPEVIDEIERHLQHLTPERAVKHADGLHDLLLRIGDLTFEEITSRSGTSPVGTAESSPVTTVPGTQPDVQAWLAQLQKQRRIITLPIAGQTRFIAAEDTGRYRDALGIPPPPGLPAAFLEYTRDPLGELISRYARTHGPFTAEEAAVRLGLGTGPIQSALLKLESVGKVIQGAFRPGGKGPEWCDSGVLRALRQKSLARLRHEVEPVDPAALGRLYLAWQKVQVRVEYSRTDESAQADLTLASRGIHSHVGQSGRMRSRSPKSALLDVIHQLQGTPIPASVLESQVLPARIPDYEPAVLDGLMSSGQVIWIGCEPLGQQDGRVALYLAEHAPLLTGQCGDGSLDWNTAQTNDMKGRIRSLLQNRGASFFPQILGLVDGFAPEVLETLWDLVWAGEVTNDTFQPVRAFLNPRRGNRAKESLRPSNSIRPRSSMFDRRAARGPRRVAIIGQAPRSYPAESAGRWSLVSSLIYGDVTPTEKQYALANQLLERYGIVAREAVQAEGIEGGFSAVYGVLKAMEESGSVRRGYFVSGLGAAQFALPGAVDRLRALREPADHIQSVILAATDPANPYGAAVSWPDRQDGRRPARMAGAIVILVDGAMAGWIGRGERNLLTFFDQVPDRDPTDVALEVARALVTEVCSARRRAIFVTEVDGQRTDDTPMAPALLEAGFSRTSHGFLKRL